MARKSAVLSAAPQLPVGSVDFNAFHDAISKGSSAQAAVSASRIDATPVPAPKDGDEPLNKEIK